MKSPGDILRLVAINTTAPRRPCNFLRTRHDDLLETSASFLGVQNTGASTHRDNKLQLTASGLSELLPDFSGKDIFVSISVNSLCLRELIKYMISIMRNNITISPPITTKRSVSILLLYR